MTSLRLILLLHSDKLIQDCGRCGVYSSSLRQVDGINQVSASTDAGAGGASKYSRSDHKGLLLLLMMMMAAVCV